MINILPQVTFLDIIGGVATVAITHTIWRKKQIDPKNQSSIVKNIVIGGASFVASTASNIVLKYLEDYEKENSAKSSYSLKTGQFLTKAVDITAKAAISCSSFQLLSGAFPDFFGKFIGSSLGLGFTAGIMKKYADKVGKCYGNPFCVFNYNEKDFDHGTLTLIKYSLRSAMNHGTKTMIENNYLRPAFTGGVASLLTMGIKSSLYHDDLSKSKVCDNTITFMMDSVIFSIKVGDGFMENFIYSAFYQNAKNLLLSSGIKKLCNSLFNDESSNSHDLFYLDKYNGQNDDILANEHLEL